MGSFDNLTSDSACFGQLFSRLHAALTQPPGVRDCCGDGLLEAPAQMNDVKEADPGISHLLVNLS